MACLIMYAIFLGSVSSGNYFVRLMSNLIEFWSVGLEYQELRAWLLTLGVLSAISNLSTKLQTALRLGLIIYDEGFLNEASTVV